MIPTSGSTVYNSNKSEEDFGTEDSSEASINDEERRPIASVLDQCAVRDLF